MREKLPLGIRFLRMPKTRTLAAHRGGKKGNFADQRNGLLSHFTDPGEPGGTSWRKSFGYERQPAKPKGGQPFIARGAPKSSSDS